jgi:Ca-activated chloride channel family protein
VKIAGQVGKEPREFAYDVLFPAKTDGDREFVEHLWARRKVGFLLDQIRINGEQKELMDEMLGLAKKYGIATPYTSYLVVPDAPVPVASAPLERSARFAGGGEKGPADDRSVGAGRPGGSGAPGGLPGPGGPGLPGSGFGGGGYGTPTAPPPALTDPALTKGGAKRSSEPAKVEDVAKEVAKKPGDASRARGAVENDKLDKVQSELEKLNKDLKNRAVDGADPKAADFKKTMDEWAERSLKSVREARENITNFEQARAWYGNGQYQQAQTGKVGVDVAICANNLRCQERLSETANRLVQGRNCLELGGLWIDEGYTADMKTVVVKAQSDAYFKILEKNPKMKDVFRLGNHLVFVTPSKTALIIDTSDGKAAMTDDEVTALFTAKAEEKKADKKAEEKKGDKK